MKLLMVFSLLLLSGCAMRRHVIAYNERVYAVCVEKHGETSAANGLELTCKPLTYPACDPNAQAGEAECQ